MEIEKKIKELEKLVRVLDNRLNSCWLCGSKKDITFHHIKPRKKYPKNNCKITLCRSCHNKIELFKLIVSIMKKEKRLSITRFKQILNENEA